MQTVFIILICALSPQNGQQPQAECSQKIAFIDMEQVLNEVTGINPYVRKASGDRQLAELSDDEIIKLSEAIEKIDDVISEIAERHDIRMVVQRSMKLIDVTDKLRSLKNKRISLQRKLSSPVVFSHRCDISNMVISHFKAKY